MKSPTRPSVTPPQIRKGRQQTLSRTHGRKRTHGAKMKNGLGRNVNETVLVDIEHEDYSASERTMMRISLTRFKSASLVRKASHSA